MKTKITLLCLLAFLFCIPKAVAQCNTGARNPSQAYTPIYDGNERIIHEGSHPGEYMVVNTFSTATIYKFASSLPTDYITITDANGWQIFASGLNGSNGLNFTPPYPQAVRFYIHANAQCESNPFSNRTRYLKTTTVTYPCDSPSNIAVSNITSNSAKVTWNAPIIGFNSSYDVYVNTTGINPVSNTNPTAESAGYNEAQLSGLNSGTTYYYWVRTECTANAGIWVPAGTFTTNPFSNCNGAPYGLHPENTFTVTCNGTVQQIATDAYPGEYSNVYVSSNKQYTFSSSVATDFITITDPTGATVYTSGQSPLVWINNSNWSTVRYYLHSNSSCGTAASPRIRSIKCGGDVVGGCTDGELHPEATFTPSCTGSLELIANNSYAGEYSNVNVTANKEYTFSSSANSDFVTIVNPAGNVVLANGEAPLIWNSGSTSGIVKYFLHSNSNCGTQNINRQRYIKCSNAPVESCGVPSALSVSNITSNSSRLTWNAPATAPASYDLYIITTNTAPVANTTATVNSTTAGVGVLSGLAASTTYYYWIRSNCGATKSAWVSGGSFTTIAALNCNGASNGLYPNATFTPSCTGNAEQIVADAYAGEYSNVNVVANKQYTFTSSIATDYLTITNATGTVVLASGLTPLSWASGSTSGVVRYHLNANANCGAQNSLRIRSIKCIDAPAGSCGVPSALSVSNITSNSSRLTWNAPATAPASYDLYIITTNTAPVANTTATVNSTTAGVGVLSGLAASTTYYYWIRSNCGATKSAWVSGGSFTTIAALNCNGASNGLYPNATFTPTCTGNAEQIVADAYAGEYSNVNVVANKQYTFTSSIATDYLTITNASGTVVLASGLTPLIWASGSTSGVVRYHLNANANCGAQNTLRIRSIKCVDAPVSTCGLPSGFAVSNITSNSCRLTWTAPAVAPSYYDIHASTTNAAPVASTPGRTSSTTADLPALGFLNPSTTYYYWVRSVCGSVKGAWVYGGSFTTNASLVCNGANRGLFPEDRIEHNNTGNTQPVAMNTSAGIYSNMIVLPNKRYTFTSSVTTDYLTITNEAGTLVLASGVTPLNWTSGANEAVVRFYVHIDSNCNSDDNLSRTTSARSATLGIDENIAGNQLKIYPNPSAGQFTVDTGDIIADGISIIDNLGRIISTHKPHEVKTTLAIDNFSDGIYYIKINYQNKNVTKKLVVKKN